MVEGLTSNQHLTRGQRVWTIGSPFRECRSFDGAWVPRDAGRCRHLPDACNPGDSSGEATPVPIPNTEVKLSSADNTERVAFREDRSSPGLLLLRARRSRGSVRRQTLVRALPARPSRPCALRVPSMCPRRWPVSTGMLAS